MRTKLALAAAVSVSAFAGLPSAALANHHACPQLTTSGNNVDVSRKDCLPVYAPYPVGGPKSPLPAGANTKAPVPLPSIQTPYPKFQPLPGQEAPPDPLGCQGPDLSGINKGVVAPVLGRPRNSDPADPYNCSGKTILYMKVPGQGIWRGKLLAIGRNGLVIGPLKGQIVDPPKGIDYQALYRTIDPVSTVSAPKPTPAPPSLPVKPPPVTLPPGTIPPVTLPPVTLPPVTLPPVTLPPVTVPPVPPVCTPALGPVPPICA